MFAKIQNRFKSIDFLGSHFEMNIKGRARYNTILGAIISLICIIVVLLGIYRFIFNLWDTKNPEVTINSQVLPSYPMMNLYADGIVPAFGLYDGQNYISSSQIQRYVTILALLITIDFKEVNSELPSVSSKSISFIPCT